jgi:hypothetical protein
MRQSMRDRIARLERTIHQGEFVITFAPWLRAKLKAAEQARRAQKPAQAPHSPAGAESEPELDEDVLG